MALSSASIIEGEEIEFSIGALGLGSCKAAASLTLAHLRLSPSPPPQAAPLSLTSAELINRARFVLSLGPEEEETEEAGRGEADGGVTFDRAVRVAISPYASNIDFAVDVADFEASTAVKSVFSSLGRRLRSPEEARNHVRRRARGVRALRSVRIPVRDGSYLLADVFVPIHLAPAGHPVLVRSSVYGRAFTSGSNHTAADRQASEAREAAWHEGSRDGIMAYFRYSESAMSANPSDWVPRGYVVVNVDARGVGQTPGTLAPFSHQEARDFCDAIEWAANQTWSNGNVGMYGGSYNATVQWAVAAMQPPSLKAMASLAGDADAYRDLTRPGGILLQGYRHWWWNKTVKGQSSNPAAPAVDFLGGIAKHVFDDNHYGGDGEDSLVSADFSRVTIPALVSVSQTALIHGRAGFEAFANVRSTHKQLLVYDANYTSNMYHDFKADTEAFFDRHLKGIQPAKEPSSVRLVLRTGHGKYTLEDAAAWPIPGTTYRELFLDAGVAAGHIAPVAPLSEGKISYSAEATPADPQPSAIFETDPFPYDIELAGHFQATLWVASTSTDADVYVAIRIMDDNGEEVQYRAAEVLRETAFTNGSLKASRRATDPNLSTAERPWHTHLESDLQPLTPNEPVQLDIELLAATGRIRAGYRLRVEISPVEGRGYIKEWSRE